MNSSSLQVNTLTKIELLGDQYLVEFINDTISFYLKHQKVPFLSKYSETLQGAHHVVPIREFIIDLITICTSATPRMREEIQANVLRFCQALYSTSLSHTHLETYNLRPIIFFMVSLNLLSESGNDASKKNPCFTWLAR